MRGIIYGILLILIGNAYAQWEPEVLLHRQGDRLGWFYEKVEGLGDWTGDGIDDFAVLTNASVVDFWWGGVTLSADPDTSLYHPDSSYFYNIKVVGDLTGDGISELVFACWDHILVYRGGRGQVEILQNLQTPLMGFTDMAIPGDISGDGLPDLVLGSSNNSRLEVYLGTPTGFEGPVETLDNVGYNLGRGLVAGADMDGDGWGDFACLYNNAPTFVLFHPQPGNYLSNHELFANGNFGTLIPQAYHAGRPALALTHKRGYLIPPDVHIHLGGQELDTIPDGTFTLDELLWASEPAYAGDVNNDGWGDWLAGSERNFGDLGAFMLFLGGPWISNYTYGHGGFTGYWAEGKNMNGVGDVNGDGIDDFAMICASDTTGHSGSQIVAFAGNEEWQLTADDRPVSPLKSVVQIEAYPNPARESVQIEVLDLSPGSTVVEIYNVLGQSVWKKEVQASGGQISTVWRMRDAKDQQVAAGVYFVQVLQQGVSLAMQKILVTG